MKKALLLLCLLSFAGMAQTREFTLASYNSLRYSPSNIDGRHPHFRKIINTMQADILVLEELSGVSAAIMFLDSVMNADSLTYSLASFNDGPDLDVALYYKSAKFSALPTLSHGTTLRDIFQFRLIPDGFQDTLHVFGVHLKASSGSTNESRRASEVAVLRTITNQLPDSTNFLVCGDFNIYSSNEAAYQDMLRDNPTDDGNFVDIITISGTWNNSSYAQYHTQSPRTTQFNGGAHGGMDDRFDMILLSNALKSAGQMSYKKGSMKVFGNDGLHYNMAIIDAPNNNQYDLAIRTALHQASDHLPVMATFTYSPSYVSLPENLDNTGVRVGYSDGELQLQNPQNLNLEVKVYAMSGQLVSEFDTTSSQYLQLGHGAFLIVITHDGELTLSQKVIN